jgi:hypothetical protein
MGEKIMGCAIGSCAQVEDGAPCYREGCGQWINLAAQEEEPEKETLWATLESKHNRGYAKSDVNDFAEAISGMIEKARDMIDRGNPKEAADQLEKTLKEMEI